MKLLVHTQYRGSASDSLAPGFEGSRQMVDNPPSQWEHRVLNTELRNNLMVTNNSFIHMLITGCLSDVV